MPADQALQHRLPDRRLLPTSTAPVGTQQWADIWQSIQLPGSRGILMAATRRLGHHMPKVSIQTLHGCRDYKRYSNFLGLKGEATNVAESQAQLKQKGDFTNKLSEKDIQESRKQGAPADRCHPKLLWEAMITSSTP